MVTLHKMTEGGWSIACRALQPSAFSHNLVSFTLVLEQRPLATPNAFSLEGDAHRHHIPEGQGISHACPSKLNWRLQRQLLSWLFAISPVFPTSLINAILDTIDTGYPGLGPDYPSVIECVSSQAGYNSTAHSLC